MLPSSDATPPRRTDSLLEVAELHRRMLAIGFEFNGILGELLSDPNVNRGDIVRELDQLRVDWTTLYVRCKLLTGQLKDVG